MAKGYQWKKRRYWHTSRCFIDDAEIIPNVGSSPVQISFRKAVATNIKLGQGLQIMIKCHFIPWHSMQILIVEPEASSSIIID
jgi:hypothetical protein